MFCACSPSPCGRSSVESHLHTLPRFRPITGGKVNAVDLLGHIAKGVVCHEVEQFHVGQRLGDLLAVLARHVDAAERVAIKLVGLEPFLVGAAVNAVLAQRLVRRVCTECGKPHTPTQAELPPGVELPPGTTLRRGIGCRECRNTGYRGRVGLYEMLTVSDDLRSLITRNVSAGDIAAAARNTGDLHALRDDGIEKLIAGKTSLEELTRAITV